MNRINQTVKELWLGLLVWGIFLQVSLIWLVKNKTMYSLGLWIGILLAGASAWHMWRALDRGLDLGDGAQKYVTGQNMIRYAVITAALALSALSGFINPLAVFAGIMGLKAAAYQQPFWHRRLHPEDSLEKEVNQE